MEPIERIEIRTAYESTVEAGSGGRVIWVVIVALVLFGGGLYFEMQRSPSVNIFDVGVKASELLVWIAGLWSIIVLKQQLTDQRTAIQQEFNWKRLVSYHELFESVPGDVIGEKMYAIAERHNFRDCLRGVGQAMPESALDAILTDHSEEYTMRAYLDEFEKFCGAIQCGLVDGDYAYSLQATRVIRTFTIFGPFIERTRRDSATNYLELEQVAQIWGVRRSEEVVKFNQSRGVRGRTGHFR